MPPPYERHLFVCTNDRGPGATRESCGRRGGDGVRDAFKLKLKERGLSKTIRGNAAGCLDLCEQGIAVVVYPEGVWYRGVTEADVDEIIDCHLVGGRPVERLLWKPKLEADR